MSTFFSGLFHNKAKIGVLLVTVLLVFYILVVAQRGWLLMTSDGLVAKAMGTAYFVLPAVGVWALVRELLFGVQTEKMARILADEGGLPVDDLPRTPGGRIVREAADAEFPKYQAEVEAAPEQWRAWFRLSCAYDAAGDRKRARASMRQAGKLFSGSGQPAA
ncbi:MULTISPECIES: hypothetical protein [Arthrobacter]|uniref:hypothetical protein n=1 Tax=Arthrobacter TaxID=1663 RepID=UPI0006DB9862|nr:MULTISPECIES: hypothetical protein [unclassified Arthrobacter]KPN17980.1 hypothetical protein AO716_08665 [Arthrobacter sp. Edens01]MSR98872.1 hypothetical protein [Arthrobacter sp. BL-252-APC-1A]